MNTLYEVGFWYPDSTEESVVYLTLEEIINAPAGINMVDVGIHLLSLERVKQGLKPLTPDQIERLKR